ncbi:MAG: hypothetical protein HBSAPP03_11810 [Phycisphaerae bacterium]|nr:MAG: hypothetical protein HBSAPP03_11810 [Phycisphaerae bacterium]
MILNDVSVFTLAQNGTGTVEAVGVPGAGTTTTPPPPAGAPGGGASSPGMGPIMWLLPVMLVVMILVSVMGSRKEKKRQAELLSSVKKGDKVQMLGGVIGTVAELGETEIVLRVEEGKIRFAKSALQGLVRPTVASGTVEAKPEAKVPV